MRREDERGLLLVVGLDNQSVSTLRNRGSYLYYGTTTASVQIRDRVAAETERPPGTVIPPSTEAQADPAAALGDTPMVNLRGGDAGPALEAAPVSVPSAGELVGSHLLSESDSAGDVTLTSDILNSEEQLRTSDGRPQLSDMMAPDGSLRVIQVNLQHGKAASAVLCQARGSLVIKK